MEEEKSIKELLSKVLENQSKDSERIKEKKFRYPFGKKVGKGQRRRNFVTVLIIYENGQIEFKKYQIEDQTILHEQIPRLANAGYVMFDKKGNPVIILPNWSVEPFSPLEHYQKSLINGSNTKGYKILIAKMRSAAIETKGKVGNWIKWVGGIILAGIIIWALVGGGGG